jgi:histidine triad (HIT) family protein
MDCVFCKINKGEIPSYTIFEDDIVRVFMDINPDCNGHILIIPKEHTLDLVSISNDTLMHIMDVARDMKKLLEEKLNIDGVTLIQNNGDIQEVKHFHLHLKPFYNEKQELMDIKNVYDILCS